MCQQEYIFNVNGFETRAFYREATVKDIFLPLLRRWTALYRKENKRVIVFLSAPPGTGKTTLSLLFEQLSELHDDIEAVQAIGLDGFHYPSEYIGSHSVLIDGTLTPMAKIKGCPETFDIAKLEKKLRELKTGDTLWPLYDRGIHDVIDDAIAVKKNIVLLEGNWLLYNEDPWAKLTDFCDDSIFISAQSDLLKARLVERKINGGLSPAAAEEFYTSSDLKNINRLMAHHHPAATELTMTADGDFKPRKTTKQYLRKPANRSIL